MSPDDAPSVTNQDPFQWPTKLVSAMAASASTLDDLIGNPKMTNTDSAPNVTWSLVVDRDGDEPVSVKCTKCEEVTTHEVNRVMPQPLTISNENIEKGIKAMRRILMCTKCGSLSLKQ